MEYNIENQRLTRLITIFREIDGCFRHSYEEHIIQLYNAADIIASLSDCGFEADYIHKLAKVKLMKDRIGIIAKKI